MTATHCCARLGDHGESPCLTAPVMALRIVPRRLDYALVCLCVRRGAGWSESPSAVSVAVCGSLGHQKQVRGWASAVLGVEALGDGVVKREVPE